MRVASLVAVLIAALVVVSGATTGQLVIAEKDPVQGGKPTFEGRDIGDNMAAPFVIPSLPFNDTGNTCPYLNDYDVACPYPESTAPDVVYAYVATADLVVNVNLCASSYDTKVYIFENVEGDVVCCNDDADCGITDYQSFMENVFLYAGNTYYFVVDGYNEDCGEYVLDIDVLGPCDLTPPEGAIIEGEPVCGPGYVDTFNGGCNSDPAVFRLVGPSAETITIFGTSGTFGDYNRDTDWYEIYITAPNTITFSAVAEFPVLIFFLDANLPLGCDDPDFVISSATASPCELVSLTETVGPGLYWLWVGPSVFACQPCGLEYVIAIDGYVGPSPVEDASWTTIKALYR
ncbi:MAG: hypothetical protein KAW67_07030 [Candidatus Eisenbacteria sp.]|nr:hypothetical protein [Candidatus Eisenbacteria bacterium]